VILLGLNNSRAGRMALSAYAPQGAALSRRSGAQRSRLDSVRPNSAVDEEARRTQANHAVPELGESRWRFADTKLGALRARVSSRRRFVPSAGGRGDARAGGLGLGPGRQAASAGVTVMTQPGLSFWSCRIR
jgi:hypothetical protein